MKLFFLISIFFCFQLFIFCQSGYLGSKNYIELKIGMVPSYRFQNVVKDDVSKERLKYGNVSYRFAYTRLLASNVELSLGYDFSRINCISTGNVFDQWDTLYNSPAPFDYEVESYNQMFLDDPRMTYHGATIGLNFYRLGSLAPIGKFIGFSFSVGKAKMKEGQEVIVGQRLLPDKENFFRTKSAIGDKDLILIPNEVNITAVHLKARIGRNYPIHDNLMLSVGMSFPVVSYYSNGIVETVGGFLNKEGYDISEKITSTSWVRYSMTSVKRYNRLMLEVAIRYHF